MDEAQPQATLVTLAILVSRVEALVLRSVLEAEGVHVCLGAVHHASVDPISLALGGHRVKVLSIEYELASAIVRESGALEWEYSFGLQRAVRRFLGLWLGIYFGLSAVGVALGAMSAWTLAAVPLSAMSVPVNPQGRGEFYLAAVVKD